MAAANRRPVHSQSGSRWRAARQRHSDLYLPAVGWAEGSVLALKPLFDRVMVIAAMPLWGPLFLLIWLAIKLEDRKSSAFFSHERTGMHGRTFKVLKFRTMVPNAQQLEAALKQQNLSLGPQFKMKNDPRVTRVGRFLRKAHLDELPQLLHILTGEMSLVGPRPCSAKLSEHVGWWRMRLDCPPGLTGPFQIMRSKTHNFDDRVRLEVQYLRQRSMLYDVEMLLRTVWVALVKREGI